MTQDNTTTPENAYKIAISRIFVDIGDKYLKGIQIGIQAEQTELKTELSRLRNITNAGKADSYDYTIKHINDKLISYIRYALNNSDLIEKAERDEIFAKYNFGNSEPLDLKEIREKLDLPFQKGVAAQPTIKTNEQSTVFIGYLWNVTKKFIDIISLQFFYAEKESAGTCVYRIYNQKLYQEKLKNDVSANLDVYEQKGEFRFRNKNLTTLVKSTHALTKPTYL